MNHAGFNSSRLAGEIDRNHISDQRAVECFVGSNAARASN
jgi:hypothetical protein